MPIEAKRGFNESHFPPLLSRSLLLKLWRTLPSTDLEDCGHLWQIHGPVNCAAKMIDTIVYPTCGLSHSSHFSIDLGPVSLTTGQSTTSTNLQGIAGGHNRNVIKYGSIHKSGSCTSASHLGSNNNYRGTASDSLPHGHDTVKRSGRYRPTSVSSHAVR